MKVLDFGLAKPMNAERELAAGDLVESPTVLIRQLRFVDCCDAASRKIRDLVCTTSPMRASKLTISQRTA